MNEQLLKQNIHELIDMVHACCTNVPRPYTAAMLIKNNEVIRTAIKIRNEHGEIIPPEYELIKESSETQGATIATLIEPSSHVFLYDATIDLYQEIKQAGIEKLIYIFKSPFYYRRNGTHNILARLGVEVEHFNEASLAKRITPLIWQRQTDDEIRIDKEYMNQAIQLARQTPANLPHPYVGVLIIKDGKIISRGTKRITCIGKNKHSIFHAERIAIEHTEENVEGSTMYTTLEPCIHLGNPHEIIGDCSTLILESGIEKVVFGMQDTGNSGVFGRGIERLMNWGVIVQNHSFGGIYNNLQNLMGKYRASNNESDPRRSLKSRL